jgi:Uma2 family endonuclease
MVIQDQLFTADELLMLPHDKHRYALIEGTLIEMSPTDITHGRLTSRIAALLDVFVSEQKLGQVYGAETGFKLSSNPDTVYGADAAFVTKARAQYGEGYFLGAPDLAVQVVSPGNSQIELHKKIAGYFDAGTRIVWVVYPKSRVVYVYRSAGEITVLNEGDSLEGLAVLPGFSVKVRDIFAVLDE